MKKQMWLYLILLSVALIAMALIRVYNKKDIEHRDLEQITQEGVVRIAVDYNSVEFHVQADSLVGFQYELAQRFARELSLEVEIHPISSLSDMMSGLESGQYDIIARMMPVTLDLKEVYGVSSPIFTSKQLLVQRKAEYNNDIQPIRNQLYLAGKTLHLSANSSVRRRLHNLMQEIGDTIYVVEDPIYQDEQLLQLVALGKIEFAVCDALVAQKLQSYYPQIDLSTDIGFSQLNAWVLRRESPVLLDSVNSFVERAIGDKFIDQLVKKYFKP
ncbi:MAG: transporter substrate-binding domain-containing protein [Bacteroidales bacterium]